MFADVLMVLMEKELLSAGCLIRMMRCSKHIKSLVENDNVTWKCIHFKIGYKQFKSIEHTIKSIRNFRCRECGQQTSRKAKLRFSNAYVNICTNCCQEEHGYNELVSRFQIFNQSCIDNGNWQRKKRLILKEMNDLHLAQISSLNKYMYWGFEWRRNKLSFLK